MEELDRRFAVWDLKEENKQLRTRVTELDAWVSELKRQLDPLSSATPSYVAGLLENIARLRKALKGFSDYFPDDLDEIDDDDKTGVRYITPDPLLRIRDIRKLRAALEASDG